MESKKGVSNSIDTFYVIMYMYQNYDINVSKAIGSVLTNKGYFSKNDFTSSFMQSSHSP